MSAVTLALLFILMGVLAHFGIQSERVRLAIVFPCKMLLSEERGEEIRILELVETTVPSR